MTINGISYPNGYKITDKQFYVLCVNHLSTISSRYSR